MDFGFFSYIFGFVTVISVIVAVHEYGHYLAARLCGVGVEVFSVGFGKRLVSYRSKVGTRWQVCALPLGGYVSFRGDMDPSSTKRSEDSPSDAFHVQPLWKRMTIVAAGPAANFVLSFGLLAVGLLALGKVEYAARIDAVSAGSPAQQAGFEVGDVFVSVDGSPIETFRDVQRRIALGAGDNITAVVQRAGGEVTLNVVPIKTKVTDSIGGEIVIGRIGIQMVPTADERQRIDLSLAGALTEAGIETYNIIVDTGRFVRRLFFDEHALAQVSGPLRIAHISGASVQRSMWDLLQITVVLSISVGLINLFPLPVLDGGHLMLGLYEAIARRRPSPRITEYAYRCGIVVLIGLFGLALYNDLSHLRVFDKIAAIFA